MPVSQRYFAPDRLQLITSSVYCRMKVFDGPRLRGEFAEEDKRPDPSGRQPALPRPAAPHELRTINTSIPEHWVLDHTV